MSQLQSGRFCKALWETRHSGLMVPAGSEGVPHGTSATLHPCFL